MFQEISAIKNSDGKIIEQQYRELTFLYNQDIINRIKEKYTLGAEGYYSIKYLSDGLEIQGYIVKPEGEGPFPVIIFNRGGNRSFGIINKNDLIYFLRLASYGFVVAASQYRGNHMSEGEDEFGGRDINDVLNIVKTVKSLSFADNDRIFMLGFSRGGMMTYVSIREGADIKAAAVIGGVSDLIQSYDHRDRGMKEVLETLIGDTPDNLEEEYIKRSAVYWPEKIDVPVLLIHGGEDWRVDVSQSITLSEKLAELNREHKLVVYPEDCHSIEKNRDDMNKKIVEWFNSF